MGKKILLKTITFPSYKETNSFKFLSYYECSTLTLFLLFSSSGNFSMTSKVDSERSATKLLIHFSNLFFPNYGSEGEGNRSLESDLVQKPLICFACDALHVTCQ